MVVTVSDMTKDLGEDRRKYPRVTAPRGFSVGWRGGGKNGVSHGDSLSLGGLFIHSEDHPGIGFSCGTDL